MSAIKEAAGRIAQSERVVHLTWLLILLAVEATGLVAAGGGAGSGGP